ncbi:unnamed protein product [Prunus brigantina]
MTTFSIKFSLCKTILKASYRREREREREMADIAILVAEEYERRVKNARKAGSAEGDHQLETDLFSCVSVMAHSLHKKIGQEKMEFVKWVMEPKSQIGLEASNGFFSA